MGLQERAPSLSPAGTWLNTKVAEAQAVWRMNLPRLSPLHIRMAVPCMGLSTRKQVVVYSEKSLQIGHRVTHAENVGFLFVIGLTLAQKPVAIGHKMKTVNYLFSCPLLNKDPDKSE